MKRTACTICKREFQLTASGVIRTHGPRESRCPGSGREPATIQTSTTSSLVPNNDIIRSDTELDTKNSILSNPHNKVAAARTGPDCSRFSHIMSP